MKRPLIGLLAALLAQTASAQGFPTRGIEIVLPYGPGGTGDIMARQIARKFEERFKQPAVVTYKAGASGAIGAAAVAKAAPDGYTLLLGYTSELAIVPTQRNDAGYTIKDFEPIAMAGVTPLVLVGRKDLPAASLKELVAVFRQPGKRFAYASAGYGSPANIAGELFNRLAGVRLEHVPYKTGPQVVADLLGGHVEIYFSGIPPAIAQIRAGGVKAFAVTGARRASVLPNVETMTEAGFPSFDLSGWFALFAPARTPAPVAEQLREATRVALADREVQRTFADNGVNIEPMFGKALQDFVAGEADKYQRLIRELAIPKG